MGSAKTDLEPHKMKVCLISALPPFRSGIALYTLGLLSGFEKARPSFSIVVMANKSANEIKSKVSNLRLVKVWTRGPRYLFQVFSSVMREKPRVTHIQHEFFLYGGLVSSSLFPLLLLLLRSLDIKVILTMHGVVPRKMANMQFAEAFFLPKNPILLKIGLVILTTLICRATNGIVVHNNFSKDVLLTDYKVSLKKIRVIPHGIGISNSESIQTTSGRDKVVLFFGNITPGKGIETLIAAFEQIRVSNAKLIIAGGPHPRGIRYFRRVTRMAQSSPASEKIVITGYVPEKRIHSLFEQCTLTVFPYTYSVSSSGGLSLALQHRKPVIVTALPTFKEIIINEKNGLIVPPRDPKALAEAIERVLLNKHVRYMLSQGIMETLSPLAWDAIAMRTSECYYPASLGFSRNKN